MASHHDAAVTLVNLCGLKLVFTGSWKTNGEVTETEKTFSLSMYQRVDEHQQLVKILSKLVKN